METQLKLPKYSYAEVVKEGSAIHGIYPCPHCSMSSYVWTISGRECLICKTIY